jgi:uncharacterized protein (UPF0332 family)
MQLNEQERADLVKYRIEKAATVFNEAKDCAELKHWSLAANRLYYCVFHAISALLLKEGISVKTHSGITTVFGQKFVKEGIFSKEDSVLIMHLKEMRNTGDYDDFMDWEEEDVAPYFDEVENFLSKVNGMIC